MTHEELDNYYLLEDAIRSCNNRLLEIETATAYRSPSFDRVGSSPSHRNRIEDMYINRMENYIKIVAEKKEYERLKDGNGAFMWQSALTAGEPATLCGYKVYTSAYAPKDKIAFGDFSYYKIGDRGTRSIKRLGERFADEGMVGFIMQERVDGILILREAVQILKFAPAEDAGL